MNKTKQITISNVDSLLKYFQLLNGVFSLTDTELEVLEQMMIRYLGQVRVGRPTDVFSASGKKVVADILGMSHKYHMNNYMKKLRDKGAILENASGELLFHPWLIPKGESQLVINLKWNMKR